MWLSEGPRGCAGASCSRETSGSTGSPRGQPGRISAASLPPSPCLGWSRSAQQKHIFKEVRDVNVSNDRAKEEISKQAGWNGLEGGGREEDTCQAALACRAPGLQDLPQRLVRLLLQVPDVGGGVETWHVCGQRRQRWLVSGLPQYHGVRLAQDPRPPAWCL